MRDEVGREGRGEEEKTSQGAGVSSERILGGEERRIEEEFEEDKEDDGEAALAPKPSRDSNRHMRDGLGVTGGVEVSALQEVRGGDGGGCNASASCTRCAWSVRNPDRSRWSSK